MASKAAEMDSIYRSSAGELMVTGTQALLLAMIRQRRFDRARGLNTAGFISGYRGSPLSSLDTEAWRVAKDLAAEDIRFQPGINEDLALTAVWGTQQTALDQRAKVEGVFAMWYGKGAGLDRCGDALRHAHGAGSSRSGGVLVVAGDDHALKSSSQAYHSEPTFIDMQMPVLYPADIQELLDYAVLGFEMSRYSGCYVGLKVLAEHVNSTAIVDVGLERISLAHPRALGPDNDRWIRWPDPWPEVERRLFGVKLPAALDFARANQLNRVMVQAAAPRLGIVVAGKSYLDLKQALRLADLSLDEAGERGLSIYKIGMPWPADEAALATFCLGNETILIIEEKRDLLESQVKSALYPFAGQQRPAVLGRCDREGEPLFPMVGELSAEMILAALAPEIADRLDERRRALIQAVLHQPPAPAAVLPPRAPYFCSGCPHNSSTVVPEGSRALGGVGCHFMATGMDRSTDTFTQMGGEGVPWIGTAPFTETDHVFVNLGEGTYFHSGSLAIRAAVAAGVNVTYKILYNDAIAMTGGQPVDGKLSVADIVRQVQAEGVKRIAVVAEDMDGYHARTGLPAAVPVSGREQLQQVQDELRRVPGVSVLIYDQVCATEKRRRRKRGTMAQAETRVLINDRVCEGCGDCSVQSNCLSVVPVETEFGRKRAIDQTNCNQDLSCLKGFCPSFVTIEGASLRKPVLDPALLDEAAIPEPPLPPLPASGAYDMLIAGVGGTGIVTVSTLLATAARTQGHAFTVHDKLGMAQKYGAVNSHLRLAVSPGQLDAVRIARGAARVLIGGDLRVSAEPAMLDLVARENGSLVIASEQAVGGEFVRNPDYDFQSHALQRTLERLAPGRTHLIPARHLAQSLLGDEIGANLILVGYAWQQGLIPIPREAIHQAIVQNGVAVKLNQAAFALGRRYAHEPEAVLRRLERARAPLPQEMTWQALAEHRAAELTRYQNAAYARRYRRLVDLVAAAEARAIGAPGALAHAVAENFAKLMAYKDEYEVARLYTDGLFQQALEKTVAATGRVHFHLAAPLIARRDPLTGLPRKRRFGPWMLHLFRLLARMKGLRGTALDPFGWHPDRREERALIAEYEADLSRIAAALKPETHGPAVEFARLPQRIRGYGHVKKAAIEAVRPKREQLLAAFAAGPANPPLPVAAE
ncbi:indolepyruvate ferredoxin oxidoreductase family protein [Rhodoligotrophos defluvii]|uniref:indolepyruvate ferredoxin oxidoreductase family protein n=1 Tax=Rhodoligotrophos defluvii TaxID=2561934 RepID=UPI0010C94191|nr:indolepyruvate ferredoxin oxidoreductase family protein [Rhodoligotrophos defluvii]